ncbi:MAG: hypothetical protein ACLTTP_04125 [Alistipes ihumii]
MTDAFGTGTSANRRIQKSTTATSCTIASKGDYLRRSLSITCARIVADLRLSSGRLRRGQRRQLHGQGSATANLKSITETVRGQQRRARRVLYHEAISVNGSFTRDDITLKRPFGLLVVKTNDLNEIKDEALKPTGYEVAPRAFPRRSTP